jgi:hypothetical protein
MRRSRPHRLDELSASRPKSAATHAVSAADEIAADSDNTDGRLLEPLAEYFAVLREWSLKHRRHDQTVDPFQGEP